MAQNQKVYDEFIKRSQSFIHVYDEKTGFMRPKMSDGTWKEDFNTLSTHGQGFIEGNAWNYSLYVPHQPEQMIELMGGKEAFVAQLDNVFDMPPDFDDSYYGQTIHEIREMQIVNMGNYAHGNQPVQHMIYLYNYANVPYKTQEKIRDVLVKLYAATPDGYCGDEDNGQTSAWYVFSALGFYPVTPGADQYVIGSPLFDKATLSLENGNKFTITAKNNSGNNYYIQSTSLNGENYTNNFIRFDDIQDGGEFIFNLDAQTKTFWGSKLENAPYSLSRK